MDKVDENKNTFDIWLRYVKTVEPLRSHILTASTNTIEYTPKTPTAQNTHIINNDNKNYVRNKFFHEENNSTQQKKKFNAETNYKKRMKKGLFGYEARIDLHGFNQNQAYDLLLDFVSENFHNHKRKLLIITGKGKFCYQTLEAQGKLIKTVPEWLKTKPFLEMVSVIEKASHYNGGDGALYVVLKKKF